MFNQLQRLLLMTSALLVLVAQTAGAEVNPEGTDTKATENVIALNEQSNSEVKIPQLDESDRPATTLKEWLSQSANQETGDRPLAQSPVQVTGVRLNQTDSGLEVILETPNVEKLQPPTRSEGNRYIADIENAQLLLPNGNSFRQANPVKGITEVTVSSFAPNSIRVTVTGTSAVPKVELFDSEEGLILGVTPAASSTQAEQTPQTPQAEQTESETQPKEPSAEGEKPIEILVTGAQEEGYVVPDASTGTKFEAPIRDIPQSIQVVPQQVLEDQGVTQLIDALRNVSSISSGSFSGDYFESISIRGFSDFSNFFTDGFRNVSSGASVLIDRANVERIEVLKGPASVLYGQGEPGGIINLVTKQPLPEPYYALEGTIGNFDFYRPALDISGPLDADRTALYRLNVAYQNSGSFVDFLDTERLFIAPVFSFQVGRNTTLVLEGSYQDNFRSDYQGVPAVGSVLSNPLGRVPRSRNLGDPDIDGISNVVGNVSYRLEHKFSDNWSIRNAFRVESYRIKEVEQIFITGLEADNRTVNRQAYQATGYRTHLTSLRCLN